MANKRSRKTKASLNPKEVIETLKMIPEADEVIDEVIGKIPEHISEEREVIEDIKEEISFENISKVVHGEIDEIKPTFSNAPIEIKIEEIKSERTMDSLSKAEYRLFQRTGVIPK